LTWAQKVIYLLFAGDTVVIEDLASRGADANKAAEGGVTALHAAAEMGNLEAVKALLKVKIPLEI